MKTLRIKASALFKSAKLTYLVILGISVITLSGFDSNPPSKMLNALSTFKLGTHVKSVSGFLSSKGKKLTDGGVARKFNTRFNSLNDAEIHTGIVVSYNDTIRTLLLIHDEPNGTKLWNSMVELYGLPVDLAVLDNNEWLINNASFSMYEYNGMHHASYRDYKYFQSKGLRTVILSEIDFL